VYNPDGSETKKAIMAFAFFANTYLITNLPITPIFGRNTHRYCLCNIVEVSDGKAALIKVDMGKAVFGSRNIPVDSDMTGL
jgi:hypothetical protein